MNSWKRLTFYLLLNVFVSACTTLAVLFVWDQFSGPMPRNLLPKALSSLSRPPAETPSVQTTGTPAAPQATPTEAFMVYQVQSGDTFESIAENHNVSVEELVAVNGFTRSQALGEGEVLRIPLNPQGSVIIDSVIGAGDLDTEHVLLKHRGEGELALVGWRLEDDKGNVFIFPQFPQLTLFPGGAVNIYTRSGVNSVVELYWGLSQPVWTSGTTVVLRDAQNNVRANYVVP
jgi:LysM repeat protein